jgi:hypothetical protein
MPSAPESADIELRERRVTPSGRADDEDDGRHFEGGESGQGACLSEAVVNDSSFDGARATPKRLHTMHQKRLATHDALSKQL